MEIPIQKNLRYQLIPSRDAADQRVPQPDWIRGKISHIQLMIIFIQKNLTDQLISSLDIKASRILQFNWTRGIPGHTQPK